MNAESSSSNHEPLSASERWIDAALTEHARLGRDGADEELILRILRQTVDRPTTSSVTRQVNFDWRTTTLTLGAIAAILALLLGVLSLYSIDQENRRSDELRFIVRVSDPIKGTPSAKPTSPTPLASTPYSIVLEVLAPPATVTALSMSPVDLVSSTDFTPTFDSLPRHGDRFENLRITADRGTTSPDGLLYEGDVLVEHGQFKIEAASVRVPKTGSQDGPLLAKQVRVFQASTASVAVAESLRFDPVSGSLVLTGVSRMDTGKGRLDHFAPGDRLVLSGEGFSVESAPVEKHASSPLQTP